MYTKLPSGLHTDVDPVAFLPVNHYFHNKKIFLGKKSII